MTRLAVIGCFFSQVLSLEAQGGNTRVQQEADALFQEQRYAQALPLYSQLVSLTPGDHLLNFRYGTCLLHGGDREKAIGHLKFAVENPATPALAWYWLGRAYHVNYRFAQAIEAYQHYRGVADRKTLAQHPSEAWEKQCRNGQKLLGNLKEVSVRNKVEAAESEFFRFYDLGDIGGRIVVLPDELKSALDKKSKRRALVYLPDKPGPIYFSSLGKDGNTGLDIYRTDLLPNGQFATPVKLAGFINTEFDEDFPFMHPDGKTFYFSSTGHNSMGGYDVFRAAYDVGMDAFGRPENLDFAINTPDDDLFYIVDTDHREACFASARSSHQGRMHVYRVSTQATPVVITIMQGTFSSAFDAADRKARIVVEDALTREKVTEVRTDGGGGYVLALPRSGRFRFLVDCGPSGKTHVGMVEVPSSAAPVAYRQELELTRAGEAEKLVIRNYFDAPLEGDMIALALDEIRRRAAMDVREVASGEVAAKGDDKTDLMTKAGYTGDISEQMAQDMARKQAADLDEQAAAARTMAGQAWTIALEAVAHAEQATQAAARMVEKALAEDDEQRHDQLMAEAAAHGQSAREAALRARAAQRTAQDLEKEELELRQKGAVAAKRSADLDASLEAGNEQRAVELLVALREDMQARQAPNAALGIAERTRRASTDGEREAARALQMANAKSGEENELADRLRRMRTERDQTKSKSRKEQLDREIGTLEGQAEALKQETRAAFNKARGMQAEAGVVRGEARLMAHLADGGHQGPVTEVPPAQAGALGARISDADARLAALNIDERFDAMVGVTVEEMEARTFDWKLPAADATALRTATRSMAMESTPPVTRPASAAPVDVVDAGERTASAAGAAGVGAARAEDEPLHTTAPDHERDAVESVAEAEPVPPVRSGGTDNARPAAAEDAHATDRFLMENQVAELRQMIAAEPKRARRDSLERAVAGLQQRMAVMEEEERMAQARPTQAATPIDALREELADMDAAPAGKVPIVFHERTTDAEIIRQVHPGHQADMAALARMQDADERASAMQGAELMLADSLRAEMALQVAILELDPAQAPVVLPRVERLRKLRAERLEMAEEHIRQRQQELLELAAVQQPDEPASRAPLPVGEDPVRDHFVAIEPDPEQVFASELKARSKEGERAVETQQRDLEKAAALQARSDSLVAASAGMPRKQFDKMTRDAYRMRDESLIMRTDLGQRSAFMVREEWRAAGDSLKGLERGVGAKGLPPSEPLVMMARDMKADAGTRFTAAEQLRKQADRSEDIMLRDSLYRTAYTLELEALRGIDQAITVHNQLLDPGHVRGASMTFEEIAAKVLGITPARPREEVAAVRPVVDRPGPIEEPVVVDEVSVAEDEQQESQQQAPVEEVAPPATRAAADVSAPVVAIADDQAARAQAEQQVDQVVRNARLDPGVVAKLERYLHTEPIDMAPMALGAVEPALLQQRRDRDLQDAAQLEQQAVEESDRAGLYTDSIGTARKRDRERLQRLAVVSRDRSDSLQAAAGLRRADAAQAEQNLRAASEHKKFVDRINAFYYLTHDEQAMVLNHTDASRYFQSKAMGIERSNAAAEADAAAQATRDLARALNASIAPGRAGSQPDRVFEQVVRERVRQMESRADSLDNVASRLRAAAALNDDQAAALLQSMHGVEPSEVMALEMRTRRTEPLLAEARGQAGPERTPIPAPRTSGPVPTSEPAPEPVREIVQEATVTEPVVERPAEVVTPPAPVPTSVRAATGPSAMQPLMADVFTMRDTPSPRTGPVPIDAPMPSGLVFKVQIGAFRNAIPVEAFSDLDPVAGERLDNGVVRYTAGMFTALEQAMDARQKVRDRGYRDAFVVAYLDGRRITLGQAAQAAPAQEAVAATSSATPATPPAAGPAVTIASPMPVPPATATTAAVPDSTLLRSYPATAQEVIAAFTPAPDAAAYYNAPDAAPARQVEMIQGLFFTVQVGVYSRPVALDRLFNISPLNTERLANGQIRYTTGIHTALELAREGRERMIERGVKDAFITAYLNGRRISMAEATAVLRKFGDEILAKP